MPRMTEQQRERWHVGLVPILAFVVTILLQTGGMVWWASNASSRLQEVETKQQRDAGRIDQLGRDQALGAVMAGRLEERLGGQDRTLARIERLLEQIQQAQ